MSAEKYRDKGNTKKECLGLLKLSLHYAQKGKGILWLAEKFFHAAIAVSSQYLIDGGRLKACCKYFYGTFLLDKYPDADTEEPFSILTEVRDIAIGKDWMFYEVDDVIAVPTTTLFCATAIKLHHVLLSEARACSKKDPGKAERLARLAERRARDGNDIPKTAEAIIEIGINQLAMNNLNNAQKTFEKAFKIYTDSDYVEGLCTTKMHMAAVMQKLGEHEHAARLLTEMGALAMENNLRLQLGKALHLLGELHLKRERPELGTQHLAEAFQCFMGTSWDQQGQSELAPIDGDGVDMDVIYKDSTGEKYIEEAEQSRLMMAISSGQEKMASFFNILRSAGSCSVSKIKIIEWKLSNAGWWVERLHHRFVPCMCSAHNRTPLDILRIQLDNANAKKIEGAESTNLDRMQDVEDITKLRSDINDFELGSINESK
ncbi:uncharacterized protein LOC126970728 [Leptidea sinapis]|uniref:uncharacterized protein LOC126970728 n=1 Tax=Leptidea sinapis TaxID=189913 RepID=UPI0021C461FE|nr:uncharacterized protein LOC126970728 [Leptidea sinapis]